MKYKKNSQIVVSRVLCLTNKTSNLLFIKRWLLIQDNCYQLSQATYPGVYVETHFKVHLFLVLLLMGFALPFLLPKKRYALTIPFHPYHKNNMVVFFLLHFPQSYLRRMLSVIMFPRSPDFPLKMRAVTKLSGKYIINTFFKFIQVKIDKKKLRKIT